MPHALVILKVYGVFFTNCRVPNDHRDTGRSTFMAFDQGPYTVEDLAADAVSILDARESHDGNACITPAGARVMEGERSRLGDSRFRGPTQPTTPWQAHRRPAAEWPLGRN
ncbi:hypothetical protein SAMN05443545_104336 [Aidingimonas halophila]|uniref:Uncharacterized protein n=1 Tax=Aidingimonas halophila TaxID=574349 RepID=A0A1H3A2C6_9GAMM|nr:hypothetical protein SAMN05443545_104336 [Aidingimonas halophila]